MVVRKIAILSLLVLSACGGHRVQLQKIPVTPPDQLKVERITLPSTRTFQAHDPLDEQVIVQSLARLDKVEAELGNNPPPERVGSLSRLLLTQAKLLGGLALTAAKAANLDSQDLRSSNAQTQALLSLLSAAAEALHRSELDRAAKAQAIYQLQLLVNLLTDVANASNSDSTQRWTEITIRAASLAVTLVALIK